MDRIGVWRGVRCSVFGFRISVFGVRCSVFGVARVAERRHDEAPDFSLGNTAPNHHQSRSDDRCVCQFCCLFVIGHLSLVAAANSLGWFFSASASSQRSN